MSGDLHSDADLVIRNGRVCTLDSKRSWAEALAISNDRIVTVGTNAQVGERIGPGTEVIDAKGRLVLPGFIDSHVHFISGFMETSWVNLSSSRSLEEVFRLVRQHAQIHPERRLIGGFGWKYEVVRPSGEYPTKHDLDEVVPDRYVLLQSYDGWVSLANSRLTDLIERSAKGKPFVPKIERDPQTGEATGVFLDSSILEILGGEVHDVVREGFIPGIKKIMSEAAAHGITSVHDAQVSLEDLDSLQKLRDKGELNVRFYAALHHHRGMTEDDFARFDAARKRFSDEWIRARAVKFFIDGVLESRTAATLEPYSDESSSRGDLKYGADEFKEIVAALDGRGFQCITHACGDRGVRTALDAYENASMLNGRRDSRHRIEHIETVSASDIPRFSRLAVIASMQPTHAVTEHDSAFTLAIGLDRLRGSFPWREIRRTGAIMAFSSDWPVASLDPLVGIRDALSKEGEPGYERTVTLQEAIESYTINGAYASFEEDLKGSIEPGKLADVIVLSEDLFEIPRERILDVEVLLTILGGRVTYRSSRL